MKRNDWVLTMFSCLFSSLSVIPDDMDEKMKEQVSPISVIINLRQQTILMEKPSNGGSQKHKVRFSGLPWLTSIGTVSEQPSDSFTLLSEISASSDFPTSQHGTGTLHLPPKPFPHILTQFFPLLVPNLTHYIKEVPETSSAQLLLKPLHTLT